MAQNTKRSKITFARIRYLDDNKVECIAIEKIKEFRSSKPRNLLDFDRQKVYRAEYEDDRNPEKLLLRVQIADLAFDESHLDVLLKTRPKFAKLNDSDIPNTSSNVSSDEENSQNDNLLQTQTSTTANKLNKSIEKKMKGSITTKRSSQVIKEFKRRSAGIPKIVDSESEGDEDGNGEESQNNQGGIEDDTNTQKGLARPLEQQADLTERDSGIIGDGHHTPPPDEFTVNTEILTPSPAGFISPTKTISPIDTIESVDDNSTVSSLMNDSRDLSGTKRRKYWVNEVIKQAIDFYEAKDGYGFQEQQKRYKPTESGKIYLGEGKEVDPVTWRLIQVEKPTVFLRDLIGILWEPYDLSNRAICLELVSIEIKNRSPVKEIESGLLYLLISLFNDFLEKQKRLSEEQKIRLLKQTTNILSQRIRDLRSEQKKEKGVSSRARRLFEN